MDNWGLTPHHHPSPYPHLLQYTHSQCRHSQGMCLCAQCLFPKESLSSLTHHLGFLFMLPFGAQQYWLRCGLGAGIKFL